MMMMKAINNNIIITINNLDYFVYIHVFTIVVIVLFIV